LERDNGRMLAMDRTIYIFIDSSNLWEAQKAKGKMLDYEKLKVFLVKEFRASDIKVFYYTAYPANGTRDYNLDGRHKFFTYLKKGLGFFVIKKELKRISLIEDGCESIKEKGNMDVEIAIDAVHHLKHYDIAVLFSGDSDFLALINYLRNHNKKVYVFSSKNNVSEELRTGADGYTDVLDVKDEIWGKDLKRRAELAVKSK